MPLWECNVALYNVPASDPCNMNRWSSVLTSQTVIMRRCQLFFNSLVRTPAFSSSTSRCPVAIIAGGPTSWLTLQVFQRRHFCLDSHRR